MDDLFDFAKVDGALGLDNVLGEGEGAELEGVGGEEGMELKSSICDANSFSSAAAGCFKLTEVISLPVSVIVVSILGLELEENCESEPGGVSEPLMIVCKEL